MPQDRFAQLDRFAALDELEASRPGAFQQRPGGPIFNASQIGAGAPSPAESIAKLNAAEDTGFLPRSWRGLDAKKQLSSGENWRDIIKQEGPTALTAASLLVPGMASVAPITHQILQSTFNPEEVAAHPFQSGFNSLLWGTPGGARLLRDPATGALRKGIATAAAATGAGAGALVGHKAGEMVGHPWWGSIIGAPAGAALGPGTLNAIIPGLEGLPKVSGWENPGMRLLERIIGKYVGVPEAGAAETGAASATAGAKGGVGPITGAGSEGAAPGSLVPQPGGGPTPANPGALIAPETSPATSGQIQNVGRELLEPQAMRGVPGAAEEAARVTGRPLLFTPKGAGISGGYKPPGMEAMAPAGFEGGAPSSLATEGIATGGAGTGLAPNASAESAASLEAINRHMSERVQGITRFARDTRSGIEKPLIGVDAVDYTPGLFEEVGMRGPQGETILNRGALARPRYENMTDVARRVKGPARLR